MAQFSQPEILNELSQVFRGRVDATRTAGLTVPAEIHAQILEIAAMVFLTEKNAIYYLAEIVRNTLSFLVRQEIAILEDMLIAIENLGLAKQVNGSPIGRIGPTDLSNAETQLLALDAAGSVQGRPELSRFSGAIDKFVSHLRDAVTQAGGLVLPKNEARSILRRDIILLRDLHPKTVSLMENTRDLLDSFIAADVPTRVSSNAIANVRRLLQEMSNSVGAASADENLGNARILLLRALVLKVAIQLLKNYQNPDPSLPKLTSSGGGTAAVGVVDGSPNEAPSGTFMLQATGSGTAASVITAPGPWLLDELSTYLLRLKIDGEAEQQFDLSLIHGPSLQSRNRAPFPDSQINPIWPGPPVNPSDPPPPDPADFLPKNNLHIVLDPEVYEFDAEDWFPGTEVEFVEQYIGEPPVPFSLEDRLFYNRVQMQPPRKLGFKHLGSPIFFNVGKDFSLWRIDDDAVFGGGLQTQIDDIGEWDSPEEEGWPNIFLPRVVTELALLHSGVTLSYIADNRFTAPSGLFKNWYVGFYIKTTSGDRYEITKVVGLTEVWIDRRGTTPSAITASPVSVYGEPNNRTEVEFSPDIMAGTDGDLYLPENFPRHAFVKIGPTVKTARIPAGAGANITLLKNTLSDPNSVLNSSAVNQPYSHPAYFVRFDESFASSDRLLIENRTRFEPEKLEIAKEFLNVRTDTQVKNKQPPFEAVKIMNSAHEVLGFDVGQKVDDKLDVYLDPAELADLMRSFMDQNAMNVEVVETDLLEGTINLATGTKTVTDPLTNFTNLGIGFGYFIELKEGDNKDTYIIESASGTSLNVQRKKNFVGSEVDIPYRVFTQQLKIVSKNTGKGSSVEILEAPSQFDLPSSIQYGTTNEVEAVNEDGERLNLSGLSPDDESNGVCIESVAADGSTATTCDPVSTGLNETFSFTGKVEADYKIMADRLNTILTSKNLFKKHGFETDVDAIDSAITPLVTPGASLQSNQNQARTVVADLLAMLTNDPRRDSEFPSVTLPTMSLNVESSIAGYDAQRVSTVDDLLDTLFEHKYDRAATLLITGRVEEFFDTDAESASFAGMLLKASRQVVQDLPRATNQSANVDADLNEATSVVEGTDAEEDFSDVGGA
jgi:hypothetical protein